MGVEIFSINLDKPTRQYSPGENVTGKLFVRISGKETSSEISIRFFGGAHTGWYDYDWGDGHSHWYESHEHFFNIEVVLWQPPNDTGQIPPGDNIFPFSIQVPAKPLPVSCSFEDGHIQYGFEGRIVKSWLSTDHKTDILPVTIFTIVDLNITPKAGNPLEKKDYRYLSGCCCGCGSKTCLIKTFTPRTGFIPGEVIPFIVEVINKTDVVINNLTASLTQEWTLTAERIFSGRTHNKPLALQVASREICVRPGEVTRWEVFFTVPPTTAPTSSPGACKIIDLMYYIQVSGFIAASGWFGSDDTFDLVHPIIIGTVPLASSATVTVTVENEVPPSPKKHKKNSGNA